jgi:OmcA/MtrC family decaheme c-type cytochrome
MHLNVRRLTLLVLLASFAATPLLARSRAAGRLPEPVKKWVYETTQLEFYLGDDGIAYIRPGVKITVASITDVAPGKKPVLDVYFTDDFDQPLDRLGKVTPGVISASWVLAWYDPATREYTSYTTRNVRTPENSPRPGTTTVQAAADAGGTWTDLELGHARYTFGTAIPANADLTKTHTLGLYSTRNLTDILGKNYYFNLETDFRPDGVAVTDVWDKIHAKSLTCNNCHDPLSAHGGSRRDVKLCVLCHSPQTIDPDTGHTMDFEVLVHKIHTPGMQQEPYVIWGNQQSIHDYSEVTYPQDVRNCANCHEGRAAAEKATQAHLWYTAPTRDACGACHTDVNFATGEGHHGVPPQTDDSQCANCHIAVSGDEFDASIKGAHTIPAKSKQLKGLSISIGAVTDLAPGKKPTVVFTLKNGDGTFVDGTKLSTFSPILAGSTIAGAEKSYTWYKREDARATAVFNATAGTTTYTFTNAVPNEAVGTWTISADVRRSVTLKRGDDKADISVNESLINPIKYVVVTGDLPARRTVVTLAQCNQCHDALSLHGGQRNNTDECVICHNPKESDVSRRPANAGQPESISFNRMIHRIHTGKELTQEYTVFGFGGTGFDFTEVTFPGDRTNCAKCHTTNSYKLPLPTGISPVTTLRDFFTPQGPGTSSCLGCHDNSDAAAHAYLNSVVFPGATNPSEACATCHGTGKDWAVEKVHAK